MSKKIVTRRKAFQLRREARSADRRLDRIEGAEKTFLVFHQGTPYTVYLMPDSSCEVTPGMAMFSLETIGRGTRRWKRIMKKARSQVNLFQVSRVIDG